VSGARWRGEPHTGASGTVANARPVEHRRTPEFVALNPGEDARRRRSDCARPELRRQDSLTTTSSLG
jgi:hypothetical protein